MVVGLGSAWYAVDRGRLFGTIVVGEWTAWPRAGRPEADPYSGAALARSGEVPLGAGEGLAFGAETDSAGAPLSGACRYLMVGQTPPARLWTLTVTDGDGRLPALPLGRTGFHSQEIVRRPDGRFEIALSASVQPGNWLQVPQGPFRLMLRLYDAPVASGGGLAETTMPRLVRGSCP